MIALKKKRHPFGFGLESGFAIGCIYGPIKRLMSFDQFRRTGASKEATRRLVMPKTLKKPSQKLLASASSEHSVAHSRLKARERSRISFQESGIYRSFIEMAVQ